MELHGKLASVSKLSWAFPLSETSSKQSSKSSAKTFLHIKLGEENKKTHFLLTEQDGVIVEDTYSHLMPEQTWDSSRAVSTPRGRMWEPLLMMASSSHGTQTQRAHTQRSTHMARPPVTKSCSKSGEYQRWCNAHKKFCMRCKTQLQYPFEKFTFN